MSSASFACKYCMGLSKVPVSTLQKAYALRCDKCQALTALSERQRSDLLSLATQRATKGLCSEPRTALGLMDRQQL
jgi:hypothetical protein